MLVMDSKESISRSDDEDELIFDHTSLLNKEISFRELSHKLYQNGCKLKVARTVNLCFSFFGLGLCFAIPTATLDDLQRSTGAGLGIQHIYTARYTGYLFGSLLGGFLFDRYNRQFLLFLSLLATSIGVIVMPFCSNVGSLMACTAITGITMGFLDTGGNVWCLDLWGRRSAPVMQTLHFCFGLGAFVAPLVAEPFLSPLYANSSMNIANNSLGNLNTSLHMPHINFLHSGASMKHLVQRDVRRYDWLEDPDLATFNHVLIKRSEGGNSTEPVTFYNVMLDATTENPNDTFNLSSTTVVATTATPARTFKPKPPYADGNQLKEKDKWDRKSDKIPTVVQNLTTASAVSTLPLTTQKTLVSTDVQNKNLTDDTPFSSEQNETISTIPVGHNSSNWTSDTLSSNYSLTSTTAVSVVNTTSVQKASTISDLYNITALTTEKDYSLVNVTKNVGKGHQTQESKPQQILHELNYHNLTEIDSEDLNPTRDPLEKVENEIDPIETEITVEPLNLSTTASTPTGATPFTTKLFTFPQPNVSLQENQPTTTGKHLTSLMSENETIQLHQPNSSETKKQEQIEKDNTTSTGNGMVLGVHKKVVFQNLKNKLIETSSLSSEVKSTTGISEPGINGSSFVTNTVPTNDMEELVTTLRNPTTKEIINSYKRKPAEDSKASNLTDMDSQQSHEEKYTSFENSTVSMAKSSKALETTPSQAMPTTGRKIFGSKSNPPTRSTISLDENNTFATSLGTLSDNEVGPPEEDHNLVGINRVKNSNVVSLQDADNFTDIVEMTEKKIHHIDTLSDLFNALRKNRLGKFEIAYVILGLYVFIVSMAFLVFLCKNPREPRSRQLEELNKSRETTRCFTFTMVGLLSLFLCLYVGIEVAVGQVLQTFTAKETSLRLSTASGYFLSYLFWGSFAISRFFTILISMKFSGFCILLTNLTICLVASIMLVAGADKIEAILWLGTVILGLGVGPLFPTSIAWMERYIHVTNKTASVFILGAAVGEIAIPLIIDTFINQEPMVLMYMNIVVNALCFVSFVILSVLAFRHGEKYLKKSKRSLYHLANMDDTEDATELITNSFSNNSNGMEAGVKQRYRKICT